MKKKQIIIISSIIVLVIILCFFIFSNSKLVEKVSPIQIIKFSDENSSIIITKNNIDKTANLDMVLYMDSNELKNDFMDLTQLTTDMVCGVMRLAFFDPEGLKEFQEEVDKWNEMGGVIEDDEGEIQGTPQGNILEGYDVKKVSVVLKDKKTKQSISDCVITGKEENDMIKNYY